MRRESSAMVGRLQAVEVGQNFKHRLFRRIQCSVFHRNANMESNMETMAQINVAQIAAGDTQPVGRGDVLTGFQEIALQAVA